MPGCATIMSLPGRHGRPSYPRQGPPPMQVTAAARPLVLASLAAVLAAGCQIPGMDRGRAETATERAVRLSEKGDHPGAARTYEGAAKSADEAARNGLWLAAAGEWVAGGDLPAAETAVAMLAPPISAAGPRGRLRMAANLALARGAEERRAKLMRDLPIEGDPAALATRAR